MTKWIPAVIVVAVTIIAILIVRQILARQVTGDRTVSRFRTQIWTVGLLFAGFLAMIFALPDGSNQDLALGVTGLVVTGALAISSQSIIANGMAGIMIRLVDNFRPGDFVEVGDHMGRVSEMGLFHTEIQSSDRDLVTLPNALMVTEPVRVVRASGTIVSANVGLGYDLSRHRLEELFVRAAKSAGLEDPFVQILDLGDYTVLYRVAGFLGDSTKLLGTRSRLRAAILDTLSEDGIEIMSPMFVARREVNNQPLLPPTVTATPKTPRRTAEDRVFDKAELAAGVVNLQEQAKETKQDIDELEASLADVEPEEREAIQARIDTLKTKLDRLNRRGEKLDEVKDKQI